MRTRIGKGLVFCAACLLAFAFAAPALGFTVVFGSDYQYSGDVDPDIAFKTILNALSRDGYTPELLVMCGDYSNTNGDYQGDALESILRMTYALEDIFPGFTPRSEFMLVQGNHDRNDGDFAPDGLRDCGSFLVYVMNTETANPWHQGRHPAAYSALLRETAARFTETMRALTEAGDRRPLFIVTHVPLHFSRWTLREGDNLCSRILYDAVTEAAKDRAVVYLFGHNHGTWGDSSIGCSLIFLAPGERIALPDPLPGEHTTARYAMETLNFAYMNAGYLVYVKPGSAPKASMRVPSLGVALVGEDGRVELLRYGENGPVPLGAAGVRTRQDLPEGWLSKARRNYVFPAPQP